jgi:pimeloyl-ACP methyl ester carboxylesterase
MSLKVASNVGPSRIEIAYECFGPDDAQPVVLVMGLGTQMIGWPEGFCTELVAQGFGPIRFDNRDVGLSSHFPNAPTPDFKAALAGDMTSASYNLSDMAADTVGLLDVLGLKSAHFLGASMGGFIAQTIAIEYPDRVRSLTSMMSATGNPSVGQPTPEAMRIFALPQPRTREEVLDNAVAAFRIIGSPGFPLDEEAVRESAGLAYDRSYDPVGLTRQALAVLASGDRTQRLKSLRVPTLVIHGRNDLMCDVSGGRATAEAIAGADLVIIDGMGHNLPKPLWPRLASLIADLIQRVEATERNPSNIPSK